MGRSAVKDEASVGQRMIRGAREALAHKRGALAGARVTRARVTVRGVEVVPPQQYSERDIQRVRERLGLSQTVFANLLGASVSTVRAWERGAREPSEMARRLLEVVERQPEVFEDVLVSSKGSSGHPVGK
jgi:DNA-binding transcriptional regulator YiaG